MKNTTCCGWCHFADVNDYYAVTLGGSQIMVNKDIDILFSRQYHIKYQVYLFHIYHKYNTKIIYLIYFHSANNRMAVSHSMLQKVAEVRL